MISDRTNLRMKLRCLQLSLLISEGRCSIAFSRHCKKRFYAPEKLNGDWQAAIGRHRPFIEAANSLADFEKEVSDLLKELQTSHLGFFHRSARRASSRAALSATYLEDDTEYGKRWIFQDVHAGGAASAAGIEPGDILLCVNDQNIVPPEHPVFTMGEKTSVEVVGADEKKRRVIVDVARPKGKKLHFVEPKLVEARHLNDGVGYLKIAMFPGLVGVEVANEISRSLAALGEIDSCLLLPRKSVKGTDWRCRPVPTTHGRDQSWREHRLNQTSALTSTGEIGEVVRTHS
jgi:carboxyl-terminal processing protease